MYLEALRPSDRAIRARQGAMIAGKSTHCLQEVWMHLIIRTSTQFPATDSTHG